MGIQESWIADYQGLDGKDYIGYPKRPTLSTALRARDVKHVLWETSLRGVSHKTLSPNLMHVALY